MTDGERDGPDTGPGPHFTPLEFRRLPVEEMRARAAAFRAEIARRRTVREYAPEPVPTEVIDDCIAAAAHAPSGANRQPWHFVVVSNPAVKRRIRAAAEAEELEFYAERAPPEWLEALAALGTDENKAFIESAPVLIAIFAETYAPGIDGAHITNYHVEESVGIATGILIAALHRAGLAMLTHPPTPTGFLNEILGRPENERPYLMLVVGYPAEGARVPKIPRKPLRAILSRV